MRKTKIFAGPAQSNSIIPIYFVYLIWFRSAARHFFHQPQQANHHHFGWVLKWPWPLFFRGKCDWGGAHMKLFLFVNLVKSQLIEISHCQPQKLPNAPNKRDIESRLAVCLIRTIIWHLFSTYFWLIIESSFAGLINFFPKMNAYLTST